MSIKIWVTPYAFVRICIYTYVYAYAIVYVPISKYRCIWQPATSDRWESPYVGIRQRERFEVERHR